MKNLTTIFLPNKIDIKHKVAGKLKTKPIEMSKKQLLCEAKKNKDFPQNNAQYKHTKNTVYLFDKRKKTCIGVLFLLHSKFQK